MSKLLHPIVSRALHFPLIVVISVCLGNTVSAQSRADVEVEIDTTALKAWLANVKQMLASGKLNLSSTAELVIDAKVDGEGHLADLVQMRAAGDPTVIQLGAELISALSQSRILSYAVVGGNKQSGSDAPVRVPFHVVLNTDGTTICIRVEYTARSATDGEKMSRAHMAAIEYGRNARRGKPEELLLRNTCVTSEGEKLVWVLSVPRADIELLLKTELRPQ